MVKRVIYQPIFLTPLPESAPMPEGGWAGDLERSFVVPLFKALQPYQQFAADGVLGPVTVPAPPQSTPVQAVRQDNFTLQRRARVVE